MERIRYLSSNSWVKVRTCEDPRAGADAVEQSSMEVSGPRAGKRWAGLLAGKLLIIESLGQTVYFPLSEK